MLTILKERPAFAIFVQFFILILILGFFWSLVLNKLEIHTYLNCYHSVFLDYFFQVITVLGDGVFAIIVSVFIFFVKEKKQGILLILTFLISALLVQILKNFIFFDSMRPLFYIQSGELKVEIVEGLKLHLYNSFPSGHTTTIFAMCSMFSLFVKSRKFGIFLFVIALATAYSRIYLSQHFFQDTLAGALIGVTVSLIIFQIFTRKIAMTTNNSVQKQQD